MGLRRLAFSQGPYRYRYPAGVRWIYINIILNDYRFFPIHLVPVRSAREIIAITGLLGDHPGGIDSRIPWHIYL